MQGMIMFPHLGWLEFHPWKQLQFSVRWELGTSFHPLCLFNVLLCYVCRYYLSCELSISKYISRFTINGLIFLLLIIFHPCLLEWNCILQCPGSPLWLSCKPFVIQVIIGSASVFISTLWLIAGLKWVRVEHPHFQEKYI